jgi:hypothetical protein
MSLDYNAVSVLLLAARRMSDKGSAGTVHTWSRLHWPV